MPDFHKLLPLLVAVNVILTVLTNILIYEVAICPITIYSLGTTSRTLKEVYLGIVTFKVRYSIGSEL
jgi:hypothetical protein